MRIFLAGATGAVGRPLVTMLVEGGHDVVGTTSTGSNTDVIAAMGATPVVMDGLDRVAVHDAVIDAEPDVVIHQLTALKSLTNMRRFDREFALTNRLRTESLDVMLAAAQEVGAKRFIAQSFTGWTNPRTGTGPATEETPLDPDPTPQSRETLAAVAHLERVVPTAPDLTGIVLRYGFLYGGGSGLSSGGSMLEIVRKRRFPIIGGGAGVWSLLHVRDAARATVLAVEHADAGLYNIVDDDPSPIGDFLPVLADAIGAKPPMRLPTWIGRAAGEHTVSMMTRIRGSSNAKAKRALGWEPEFPSWREGFRAGLG